MAAYSARARAAQDTRVQWHKGNGTFIPRNAVPVGYTKCDQPLFAGRIVIQEVLPAAINPAEGKAISTFHDETIEAIDFEILESPYIAWQDSRNVASIGEQALRIGQSRAGEPLYFGRAFVNGVAVPGKIHETQKGIFVPYQNRELKIEDAYEIMILSGGELPPTNGQDSRVQWQKGNGSFIPQNAVPVGYTKCGEPLYAGRLVIQELLPAVVNPAEGKALSTFHGETIETTNFEILEAPNIAWKDSRNGGSTGKQALLIGQTRQGENLYFGRTFIDGLPVPGKIGDAQKCIYVPYQNQQLKIDDLYEIMILI